MEVEVAAPPAQPKEQCPDCKEMRVLRIWRGQPICWECWHWHKLGRNEANYWTTGIAALFKNEYGYGPDPNDVRQWEKWGVVEEVATALRTLEDLAKRYQAKLDERKARG